MRREDAINVLNNAGIKAEATETNKNGVLVEGIVIGDGSIRVVVYTNFYESVETEDELIDKVNDIVSKEMPNFDISALTNKYYVLQNAFLCIGKGVRENAVQRPFIDMVVYIRVGAENETIGKGSFILCNEHLNAIGVTKDEIFEAALYNTRKNVKVTPILEILRSYAPIGDDIPEMTDDAPQLIVASNKDGNYGASAMLNTDALDKVASDNNVKELIIIPSSIHEVILIPYDADKIDAEAIKQMVPEVNDTNVDPRDVLSDNVYFYDTETKGYSFFEA